MEAPQTVHLKVGDQSPGPPPFSFSLLLALLSLGQQMNRSHLISGVGAVGSSWKGPIEDRIDDRAMDRASCVLVF